MRIGGFDHTQSTTRLSGTSSGLMTWTLPAPAEAAFREVSSRARGLVSTAKTVESGAFLAKASVTGPHPQPTSTSTPVSGGVGAWASKTAVPRSSPPGENVPEATATL